MLYLYYWSNCCQCSVTHVKVTSRSHDRTVRLVIPRLYGRGYIHYLGLRLGVNKKVHIRKITLGIILCTLFNKSNVIRR